MTGVKSTLNGVEELQTGDNSVENYDISIISKKRQMKTGLLKVAVCLLEK